MEGVMMRNGDRYAVAVRTVDGKIAVSTQEYHSLIKAEKLAHIPIVRGVFSFIDSLVLGMKSLMYSADFYAQEDEKDLEERLKDEQKKAVKKADRLKKSGKTEEADKIIREFDEKAAKERAELKKRSENPKPEETDKEDNGLLMGLTVTFSLVISIALFIMLPYALSRLLHLVTSSEALISIAEAVLRMVIFFGYLWVISRMKDIERTFMYHGAEHKCINCIEHGLELNVENVRKSSREHKRCGTSFLLYVCVVSVIFFLFIRVSSPVWRVLVRLLLMPVIAGVSYEFIRLAGRYDNWFVNMMSKPGLALQHMTTREPDDSQIEVGIASVEAVFNWKKYLNENFGYHYDLSGDTEREDSGSADASKQQPSGTDCVKNDREGESA